VSHAAIVQAPARIGHDLSRLNGALSDSAPSPHTFVRARRGRVTP